MNLLIFKIFYHLPVTQLMQSLIQHHLSENQVWDSTSTESTQSESLGWLSQRRMMKSSENATHSKLTQLTWSLIPCWLSRRGISHWDDRESYTALTQCSEKAEPTQAYITISGALKGQNLEKINH
jgi:hypothetical protein